MASIDQPALADRLWAPFDSGSGHGRLFAMEGLRGVAVLLVFLVHFHTLFERYLDPGSALHTLSAYGEIIGHSGVDLFFILSGYLIFGGFFSKAPPLGQYFRRRARRIHPTFLVVLAVYIGLSMVIPGQSKLHGSAAEIAVYLLANVLLLPGILHIEPIITVAWSLSYEWFFYLVIPPFVTLTRMRAWTSPQRVRLFVLLGVAHVIVCTWLPGLHPRLAVFFAGMVLYERIGATRETRPGDTQAELRAVLGVALAFVATVLLRAAHPEVRFPNALGLWIETAVRGGSVRVAVLAVAFYVFVRETLGRHGVLHRALSWKPLRALGNMSYSYYLIHGLALKAVSIVVARAGVERSTALFLALYPVGLLATVVASAGLYLAVEKPISLGPVVRRTSHA